jgi:hypothetical protein
MPDAIEDDAAAVDAVVAETFSTGLFSFSGEFSKEGDLMYTSEPPLLVSAAAGTTALSSQPPAPASGAGSQPRCPSPKPCNLAGTALDCLAMSAYRAPRRLVAAAEEEEEDDEEEEEEGWW